MPENQRVIKRLQVKQKYLCLICNIKRHRLAILLPIDAFGTNTFKALKAPQGPISAYQYQTDTTSPNSLLPRALS